MQISLAQPEKWWLNCVKLVQTSMNKWKFIHISVTDSKAQKTKQNDKIYCNMDVLKCVCTIYNRKLAHVYFKIGSDLVCYDQLPLITFTL